MLRSNRHQFKKMRASILHTDGHRYTHKYSTSDSEVFCCDFKLCKAKARVNDAGHITIEAGHSHLPSTAYNRVREVKSNLRCEAQSGKAAPARHLLSNAALNLDNEALGVIDPDRTRRMLNYNRRMAADEEVIRLDLPMPEFVGQQRRIAGRPFLRYDSESVPTERHLARITIFASDPAIEQLQTIRNQCGDGTMNCLSNSLYRQLYIIAGMWDSHSYIPLIFVMMQDQHQDTYRRVFEQIKIIAPRWNIDQFMSDMELAIVNVVRYFFPHCSTTYCNFHLVKVWKESFLRLHGDITDPEHNEVYYKVMALPYLPPQEVYLEFPKIVNSAPPQLAGFLQYLRNNYCSAVGSRFPVENWSVYECIMQNQPRTNNALESQNGKLNESVRIYNGHRKKSTVSSCLKAIGTLEGSRALVTRNSVFPPIMVPGATVRTRTNAQKEFDRAALEKLRTFQQSSDKLCEIARLLKARRLCLN